MFNLDCIPMIGQIGLGESAWWHHFHRSATHPQPGV